METIDPTFTFEEAYTSWLNDVFDADLLRQEAREKEYEEYCKKENSSFELYGETIHVTQMPGE